MRPDCECMDCREMREGEQIAAWEGVVLFLAGFGVLVLAVAFAVTG